MFRAPLLHFPLTYAAFGLSSCLGYLRLSLALLVRFVSSYLRMVLLPQASRNILTLLTYMLVNRNGYGNLKTTQLNALAVHLRIAVHEQLSPLRSYPVDVRYEADIILAIVQNLFHFPFLQ